MTTISRLLRACATGHGCRALINTKVLNTEAAADVNGSEGQMVSQQT